MKIIELYQSIDDSYLKLALAVLATFLGWMTKRVLSMATEFRRLQADMTTMLTNHLPHIEKGMQEIREDVRLILEKLIDR